MVIYTSQIHAKSYRYNLAKSNNIICSTIDSVNIIYLVEDEKHIYNVYGMIN